MRIFFKKANIVCWVLQKIPIEDAVKWALNKIHWSIILHWGLKLAILVLRSDWVKFDKKVPGLATFIALKLSDGNMTDNDLADILEELDKEFE